MHAVTSAAPTVSRLDVDGVLVSVSAAASSASAPRAGSSASSFPESHYLGSLEASRRRVLAIAALLVLAAPAGAALMLRAMRRDLGRLIARDHRSAEFRLHAVARAPPGHFATSQAARRASSRPRPPCRALGKYVPLDLVRELYDAHREPVLGAELQDVTLLFSDIAGFTTVAEALASGRPGDRARRLPGGHDPARSTPPAASSTSTRATG